MLVPHAPNSVNSRDSRSYSDHAGAGVSESVRARINASFSNRSDSFTQIHPVAPSTGSVSSSHQRSKMSVKQIFQTYKDETQVSLSTTSNLDEAVKKKSKEIATSMMNKLHPEASVSSHDDWYCFKNRAFSILLPPRI